MLDLFSPEGSGERCLTPGSLPKARRLFIEIANVLKEKEGFDEDLLAEALVHTEL